MLSRTCARVRLPADGPPRKAWEILR
jgi:hypothetical protein